MKHRWLKTFLNELIVVAILMLGAQISPGNASEGLCNDRWRDGLPINGVSGTVYATAVDAAGNVYVGGSFLVAGDTVVNNVAKWDGTRWHALGSGLTGTGGGWVNALVISGADVYAAGGFNQAGGTSVSNVAKWNGSSWSAVGTGVDHWVTDLETFGNALIASSYHFDVVIGSAMGSVSRWDGSTWSELGEMNGYIYDLAVSGQSIYAGGEFSEVNQQQATNIVRWNGATWSNVGTANLSLEISALAVSGADLYATGRSCVAGTCTGRVAKWNGSSWSDLGSGMTGGGWVGSIAVSGGDVYAGGSFESAGGTPARNLAKWNGSSWSAVPGAPEWGTWSIVVSGTDIYVGGSYTELPSEGIAKLNGTTWSSLGSGTRSRVAALTASSTDVYAAGYFTTDDGATFSRAAKWNGSGWTPLGPSQGGANWTLKDTSEIAVFGTDVYIAGRAGAWPSYTGYVSKWNGSAWFDLGSGMTSSDGLGYISAIAVSGSDVYAVGRFSSAGGVAANNAAKWNGSAWSALGTGLTDVGGSSVLSGNSLYAGSAYSGGIGKWDGSSWATIWPWPSGLSTPDSPADWGRPIDDIEVSGNELYVATGMFDDYGGGFGAVLKWNGSQWSELPRMCCAPAQSVAVSGSRLYVGGSIQHENAATPLNYIAKWNGSNWEPLGSGMDGSVSQLAIRGRELFVAGGFNRAGCHTSPGFARYAIEGTPFDYDGDGKSDVSTFRPSDGVWYLNRSTAGVVGLQWGTSTDKIAPADYDGDARTDVAVYRPSEGRWYIFNSSTSTFSSTAWGVATDIPAPGDFDADGRADVAIFRPSDGNWWLNRTSARTLTLQFGQNGDHPVVADYDGDGKADVAAFRPSTGVWYIFRSATGVIGYQFGVGTDKVAPADYDGDGKTDIAVYRPSEGKWYIVNSGSATYPVHQFGVATDIPAPGDYDGDGRADIAIFRPSDGNWWINRTTAGLIVEQFGQSGDKPTPSAFGN